jgi:hypothetical protein
MQLINALWPAHMFFCALSRPGQCMYVCREGCMLAAGRQTHMLPPCISSCWYLQAVLQMHLHICVCSPHRITPTHTLGKCPVMIHHHTHSRQVRTKGATVCASMRDCAFACVTVHVCKTASKRPVASGAGQLLLTLKSRFSSPRSSCSANSRRLFRSTWHPQPKGCVLNESRVGASVVRCMCVPCVCWGGVGAHREERGTQEQESR